MNPQKKMPETDPEQELVSIGPMKIQVSKETMKALAPFVGWSLIIVSAAALVAATVWGSK
jgi:hypothetical protein